MLLLLLLLLKMAVAMKSDCCRDCSSYTRCCASPTL
jgi:hypothetical protein